MSERKSFKESRSIDDSSKISSGSVIGSNLSAKEIFNGSTTGQRISAESKENTVTISSRDSKLTSNNSTRMNTASEDKNSVNSCRIEDPAKSNSDNDDDGYDEELFVRNGSGASFDSVTDLSATDFVKQFALGFRM